MQSLAHNKVVSDFINHKFGGRRFAGMADTVNAISDLKRKENLNPVTKARLGSMSMIRGVAKEKGKTEQEVGAALLKKNKGKAAAYVLSKGEKPARRLDDLAAQVYRLRSEEVKDVADFLEISPSDALIVLEHAESELYNDNNAEADNFIDPVTASAVISTAGNFISGMFSGPDEQAERQRIAGDYIREFNALSTVQQKQAYINERDNLYNSTYMNTATKVQKRYYDAWQAVVSSLKQSLQSGQKAPTATGQPTPNGGGLDSSIIRNVLDSVSDTAANGGGNIGDYVQKAIDKVKAEEKKKEINKMLPYIIGGVVLLILVTVLIVRRK